MKIGIDARMYGPKACTGIGQYIRQLTNVLFDIDKENEYVIFLKKEMYDQFETSNARVKKVLADEHWYGYKEQLVLPFIFYKEKVDLMHFPNFNHPIFYKKPFIITIHDITPFFFPGHKAGSSKYRKWAYDTVFRHGMKRSKKIIAVSQSTKDLIIKYFKVNPDKIAVTYEGVDDKFKKIQDNDIINKVKNKYKIDKDFIFFVGVWRNHKNVEGLVRAFDILKKIYKWEGKLVIGGQEDSHYKLVSQIINKLNLNDEVIRPGFISDDELPVFFNMAKAFVNPSFIEGFGLNNLEAHACGCPVVSSNSTSLPEVSGDAAMFFDPKEVEEMARRINTVLTDEKLRKEMVKRGYEQVKKFSWENCAKQTLEVYKSL